MNFHLAGNLVAQQIRDEKLALKVGGSGTGLSSSGANQRKNNRRQINIREVDAVERLYRESNIVAAAIDQICDDIESGYLAIDNDPSEAIKEGSKPQNSESAAYKSLLMKMGVDFCRAILLYRMCVVAIPRTKEAPFIAPMSEYKIEFEQLVAGGRWYYVSHRLSDKERFKEEPLYFLAIVNEPDIRGTINSPMVRLIEDFNLVSIKRAMSIATDLSNLVPPVYATKDVKDKDTKDKAPGFFMGEDHARLQREAAEAERLQKARETGAINIPAAAPLVPFSDLMSKVIQYEGEKTALEKLVGLLESNTFKSATIIETEEQKLVPAGRPAQVGWIEDQEQFVQLVAMATKYPSDLWNSAYTKVSSAAENSREKKKNCLRSNIRKVEQFLEFLVNEEYNRVIDRFNETFADSNSEKVLTMPVNGGIGNSNTNNTSNINNISNTNNTKAIEPRIDPVSGSHAYEFGAVGHLPVTTAQDGPSEVNPDVPLKQHEDQIKSDVLGEALDAEGKKKNKHKSVRIILPISKDELVELDTMGRVDGKTMQFMLAAQYGGSPDWFNEEVKLPVPPAPEQPGGIGGSSAKRKKPSGGGSSAVKKKKKKPGSGKPKSKSVKASKAAYSRHGQANVNWNEGTWSSEDEDDEEEDAGPVQEEWSSEEQLVEPRGVVTTNMPPPPPLPSVNPHPLPLPSNLKELTIHHLLNNGIH